MNNMKNILTVIFSALLVSSCVDDFKVGNSFLEKAPGVDVTKDSIFGKAEYARRFLWDTYSGLYYGLPVNRTTAGDKMNMGVFEALSDVIHTHLTWDAVNAQYYTGNYNAGMEDNSSYTRFGYNKEDVWTTVRKAWVFIENVVNVPDMEEDEKQRLAAEAKVIIASRYFDAYRHFGGLPIVSKAYTLEDDMTNPRATVEETNDFMIKLLDEAIPSLPWVLAPDEYKNWDGRMTQAAAMGLKCKILLFTASPLFNDTEPYCTEAPQDAVTNHQVWLGSYKPELWDRCLKACEEFFATVAQKGSYHMVQAQGQTSKAYRDAYRKAYYTRGSGYENPEMLISTRVRYKYNNDWDKAYYFPQSCKYGAFTPTQEFVEMFPMSDGTPFDWNNPAHRAKMFKDRDPRLFETVACNQTQYQNREIELWIGGREAKQTPKTETQEFATGYGMFKFILDRQAARNRPLLWPYLRMAEVHLIYAEALMKTNHFDEAIDELDKVRARVGLKSLRQFHDASYLHSEEGLMNEILRERACELGVEDVRFFDLIRNKLEKNFTTPLHGLRIYRNDNFVIPQNYTPGEDRFRKESDNSYVKDENGKYVYKGQSWSDKPKNKRGPKPTSFSYERFKIANKTRFMWKPGNYSTKWLLTAFPPTEINKDYGLTQNPGW